VYIVHFAICMFMWFGCLLPKQFLIYHIVSIFIINFHFLFTDDRCSLTILEDALRNRPSSYEYTGQSPFFAHIFELFGVKIKNKQSDTISGRLVQISFVISFIRYCIE
jgi:hypothetical protein